MLQGLGCWQEWVCRFAKLSLTVDTNPKTKFKLTQTLFFPARPTAMISWKAWRGKIITGNQNGVSPAICDPLWREIALRRWFQDRIFAGLRGLQVSVSNSAMSYKRGGGAGVLGGRSPPAGVGATAPEPGAGAGRGPPLAVGQPTSTQVRGDRARAGIRLPNSEAHALLVRSRRHDQTWTGIKVRMNRMIRTAPTGESRARARSNYLKPLLTALADNSRSRRSNAAKTNDCRHATNGGASH
jgi:hypothetical protein